MSASRMSTRPLRTAATENGDAGERAGRVGLSDYTTQRLAQLRARRAEADDYGYGLKTSATTASSSTSPATATSATAASATSVTASSAAAGAGSSAAVPAGSSTTASAKASSTSLLGSSSSASVSAAPSALESYRARRGLSASAMTSSLSSSSSSSSAAAAAPSTDGQSRGLSSYSSQNGRAAAVTTATSGVTSGVSTSGSGVGGGTPASAALRNGLGGAGGTGASFSKADYLASRTGSDLLQGKTGSGLGRSGSRAGDYGQDDDECVGFASLPEQVHRKAIKRGFDFTVMVVGESGLGKSTLVSSLFLNDDLYKDRKLCAVEERVSKTVEIQKKEMEIEEKGVKLRLTIVDTPGFNDAVNSEQSWKPIEDYINQQFDQFYKDESGLNRKNIKDNRVHCCLYFISPYGHGLRQTDVEFMRRLHDKVNIVPVVAKSDTLTPTEIIRLKARILDEIDSRGIRIYEFPDCDSDEDEEFKKQDQELKASIPFAVIGSNSIVEVNGKRVRGRLYPWGIVEVDNPTHCDFAKLRQMLISTHMQDLKDVTRDIHYEAFRARHIKEQMTKQQRERKLEELGECIKQNSESKLKRDSSPNFDGLMDQDKLLQQKDEEIRKMQEMLRRMQAQLTANNKTSINGLGNL